MSLNAIFLTLNLIRRLALKLQTLIERLCEFSGFIIDFLKEYCVNKPNTVSCKIEDKTNHILAWGSY